MYCLRSGLTLCVPTKRKSNLNMFKPCQSAFLFDTKMTMVVHIPEKRKSKKKLVLLLSSVHSQLDICADGKPEIIHYYDSTKGGVETFDQMCALYSTSRKNKQWPLAVFYDLLNTAVINASVLYNNSAAHTPAALMLLAIHKRICNMTLSLIFVVLVCRTGWTICISDYTA